MTRQHEEVQMGIEPMRAEILHSWRRIEGSGLSRDSDVRTIISDGVDYSGSLARAAEPVIEDLAHQLRDTDCALLLADRNQQIVTRRCGERRVALELDRVIAVPGATYSEENTGTNALSTVFETRAGVFVSGEEHYLAKLHGFNCYGHPIIHPITGVMEGVLDITGLSSESKNLMRALIISTARAIEGRLLLASPSNQIRLLGAYQARVARFKGPVLAFGRDVTLMNDAATQQVDEESLLALRSACSGLGLSGREHVVPLPSQGHGRGLGPSAVVTPVDGAPGSFVLEIPVPEHSRRRARTASVTDRFDLELKRIRQRKLRAVLVGESGTGRTTMARQLGEGHRLVSVTPETHPQDVAHLIAQTNDSTLMLVDDFDRYDPKLAEAVAKALKESPVWAVATAGFEWPRTTLLPTFPIRVKLPPLRERSQDIPNLARGILQELNRASGPIAAAALHRLTHYPWPGNLTELHAVLHDAVLTADGDAIGVRHLPETLAWVTSHPLGPLEQAEYKVLLQSLERHNGNKSRVAADLGISRSTLYRRMRGLGMPV
jgi:transcriptional regulator of acetoin/glycerol metabolism